MKRLVKEFLYTLLFSLAIVIGYMNPLSYAGEMHDQRTGNLTGAGEHSAEGSVDIQGHRLTLSNMEVDKVPDGRVYLTNDANFELGVELGRLTQFSGTINYTIPANVNPDDYNSVLIWCKKFSVEIGHADLKDAMQ